MPHSGKWAGLKDEEMNLSIRRRETASPDTERRLAGKRISIFYLLALPTLFLPTIVPTAAPFSFPSATSVIASNGSEASQHTTDLARDATPLIGQVGERSVARVCSAAIQLLTRVPGGFGAFSRRHHAHRSAWRSLQDHQPRQKSPLKSWPVARSNFFHSPTLKVWILQLLNDELRYQVFTTRDL